MRQLKHYRLWGPPSWPTTYCVGYRSPLDDELYAGWRTADFDIANHVAGGKSKARETERLWLNS
jgi:hypothetical protein